MGLGNGVSETSASLPSHRDAQYSVNFNGSGAIVSLHNVTQLRQLSDSALPHLGKNFFPHSGRLLLYDNWRCGTICSVPQRRTAKHESVTCGSALGLESIYTSRSRRSFDLSVLHRPSTLTPRHKSSTPYTPTHYHTNTPVHHRNTITPSSSTYRTR